MNEPPRHPRPSALDWIHCEINSKCASLRAASRLLPDLSAPESEEMLRLMSEEAFRLAKSIEKYRQDGGRQ